MQPFSTKQQRKMPLPDFLHLQKSPHCKPKRAKLHNHPYWQTVDGRVLWLDTRKGSSKEYMVRASSLDDFYQKDLVRRGVALLDDYLPPARNDTPILKRRAQHRKSAQRLSRHSKSSNSSRVGRKTRATSPTTTLKSHKPRTRPHSGHQFQQAIHNLRTEPGTKKPHKSHPKALPFRLEENDREAMGGTLIERTQHFLARTLSEQKPDKEQEELRWLGINEQGHIVLTKPRWFSFFFRNASIRRFIAAYEKAMYRHINGMNNVRKFYDLSPLSVELPRGEGQCHGDVISHQIRQLQQANGTDFLCLMNRHFDRTKQLLQYQRQYQGHSRHLAPVIQEQLVHMAKVIVDWIDLSPSESEAILLFYQKSLQSLIQTPKIRKHCPRMACRLLPEAQSILEKQLRQ